MTKSTLLGFRVNTQADKRQADKRQADKHDQVGDRHDSFTLLGASPPGGGSSKKSLNGFRAVVAQ